MTHLEDIKRLRNLNYSFAETTALRNRIKKLTKENIILKSSKQELEAKIEILTQQIKEYDLYE